MTDITFLENNIKNTCSSNKLFLDEFLHGLELKSYNFNKYKSKKDEETYKIFISLTSSSFNQSKLKKFDSLIQGITLTS